MKRGVFVEATGLWQIHQNYSQMKVCTWRSRFIPLQNPNNHILRGMEKAIFVSFSFPNLSWVYWIPEIVWVYALRGQQFTSIYVFSPGIPINVKGSVFVENRCFCVSLISKTSVIAFKLQNWNNYYRLKFF